MLPYLKETPGTLNAAAGCSTCSAGTAVSAPEEMGRIEVPGWQSCSTKHITSQN